MGLDEEAPSPICVYVCVLGGVIGARTTGGRGARGSGAGGLTSTYGQAGDPSSDIVGK